MFPDLEQGIAHGGHREPGHAAAKTDAPNAHRRELRDGECRLVSVLDDYAITRPGFYLYFPRANARLGLLRLFFNFLKPECRPV